MDSHVVRSSWNHRVFLDKHHQALKIDQIFHRLSTTVEAAVSSNTNLFKNDKTTTVVKARFSDLFDLKDSNDGDFQVVIKRYNARNQFHRFKRVMRQSRAMRCLLMGEKFQLAGIEVAQTLLVFEKRLLFFRGTSYLVSRFIKGEQLLDMLPIAAESKKTAILRNLKNVFQRLRKFQLKHGDMKGLNILWNQDRLIFIDLDAASAFRSKAIWKQAHKKDCHRLLKNWRDVPELQKQVEQAIYQD